LKSAQVRIKATTGAIHVVVIAGTVRTLMLIQQLNYYLEFINKVTATDH